MESKRATLLGCALAFGVWILIGLFSCIMDRKTQHKEERMLSLETALQEQQSLRDASMAQGLLEEHGFVPLRVEGELPEDLSGTLVRNGPGLVGQFGHRYGHLFESDGALTAVRFGDKQAEGAVRVVRSEGLLEERARGRCLYGFSAAWPQRFWNARRGRRKNTANTSVMVWQDRLFALMEAGLPTEIAWDDLDTIGECDLDGVIEAGMFSAHPHLVPERQTIYNFGLHYGKDSRIDLFALPFSGKPQCIGRLPLKRPVMLHDFMATERHLVFFVSPSVVKVWRALLMVGSFEKMIQWAPEEGTEIIVVPIDEPNKPVRFHVDPFYQWHFANGFERGDSIVLDLIRYHDFASFSEVGKGDSLERERDVATWGKYCRAIVEPKAQKLHMETLYDELCEFPRIHPRCEGKPHRYTWFASNMGTANVAADEEPVDRLVKFDTETQQSTSYAFAPGQIPSEPIFVPRKDSTDEDDGYLLSLVYDKDSHTSFVAVLDAQTPTKGPLANVWFSHHIPGTFHGVWQPSS